MDTTAQIIHECKTCNYRSQVVKTSLEWRMTTEIEIWGDWADRLSHTPSKLQEKMSCPYNGGSNT